MAVSKSICPNGIGAESKSFPKAIRVGTLGLAIALFAPCLLADPGTRQDVTFVVSNIKAEKGALSIAFFKPSSPEFSKRFKDLDKADLHCRKDITGSNPTETMHCSLDAGKYAAIAYVDTDANGTLTHGMFGPKEQYGFPGGEAGSFLPPDPERVVIDTSASQNFKFMLR